MKSQIKNLNKEDLKFLLDSIIGLFTCLHFAYFLVRHYASFSLLDAVLHNRTKDIQRYLKYPHYISKYNLHFAIRNGEEETVRTLLQAGANPNSDAPFDSLTTASYCGNIGIVNLLLENNANVFLNNVGPLRHAPTIEIATAITDAIVERRPDQAGNLIRNHAPAIFQQALLAHINNQ